MMIMLALQTKKRANIFFPFFIISRKKMKITHNGIPLLAISSTTIYSQNRRIFFSYTTVDIKLKQQQRKKKKNETRNDRHLL